MKTKYPIWQTWLLEDGTKRNCIENEVLNGGEFTLCGEAHDQDLEMDGRMVVDLDLNADKCKDCIAMVKFCKTLNTRKVQSLRL